MENQRVYSKSQTSMDRSAILNNLEKIGSWKITIHSSLQGVWKILNDSSNMAIWGRSFVKHTTAGKEYLGAVRNCELQMGNKIGKVKEETIIYKPTSEIFWKMKEDNLGMKNIMNEFVFGFTTKSIDCQITEVQFEQYYRPSNIFKRLLVKLMMKPKMGKTNKVLLQDLKRLIEKGQVV
ncbi:SRPBCC family protein [Xanthovirga aplysinae]|uniref:SRPBCC family protein n=1 Tax=Xanthovirga aplysinae TaxID=2529853 RepID=UPI0012BD0F30|nr:SRPBCC family protein [Xanthovirga aplysinae]MTI31388.1 hypothetical protein [Xanthovirga aplysinae]